MIIARASPGETKMWAAVRENGDDQPAHTAGGHLSPVVQAATNTDRL